MIDEQWAIHMGKLGLKGSGEASVEGRASGRVEDEATARLFGDGGMCSRALRMGRKFHKSLVCADSVASCTVISSYTTKDEAYSDSLSFLSVCVDEETPIASSSTSADFPIIPESSEVWYCAENTMPTHGAGEP